MTNTNNTESNPPTPSALSAENQALIMVALGQTYWEPDDGWVWLAAATDGDLNALLNAARNQARTPVEDGGGPDDETYKAARALLNGHHATLSAIAPGLGDAVRTVLSALATSREGER